MPDGLDITYQGIPCAADYSFTLVNGTGPSFGYVRIPRRELDWIGVSAGMPGLDSVQLAQAGARRLRSVGRLIVQERFEDVVGGRTTTFERVYVDSSAMTQDFVVEDNSEVYTIRITSQEYRWGAQGTITSWVNVPKEGVGQDPQRLRSVVDANDHANEALNPSAFIRGSLTTSGELKTLEYVLRNEILPALPGAPSLVRLPAALRGTGGIPIGHIWPPGTMALRAFEDILKEFDLIYSPRPDGDIALWGVGEGRPQDQDGRDLPEEVIATNRGTVAYTYAPVVVQVVGPPQLSEWRAEWLTPVGEVDGQIVSLQEALIALGLPFRHGGQSPLEVLDHLRSLNGTWASGIPSAPTLNLPGWLALQDDASRSTIPGVLPETFKEFDRWAFKWFQLPGGPARWGHLLPMLNRPSATGVGRFEPITVEVETVEIQDGRFAIGRSGARGTTTGLNLAAIHAALKRLEDFAVARGRREEELLEARAFPEFVRAIGATITTGLGFGRARKLFMKPSRVRAIGGPTDEQMSAAYQTFKLNELRRLASDGFQVLVNAGMKRATGGFTVDRDLGIIKFDKIVGHVKFDAEPVANNELDRPGRVDVTFGYRVKPPEEQPLSDDHSYVSWWGRQDDDSVIQLDSRPQGNPYPVPVKRDELQLVETLNGDNNRRLLDTMARKIATPILSRPRSVDGAILTLARPIDAVCTGMVESVTWSGEPAGMTLHAANKDPRLRSKRLRTVPEDGSDLVGKHPLMPGWLGGR